MMKAGKVLVIFVAALLALVVIFPGSANALDRWFICTVIFAGSSDSGVEVKLERVSDQKSNIFYARAGEEDRMLAIALTAMNGGLQVRALVNWNQTEHNEILSMRLLAD